MKKFIVQSRKKAMKYFSKHTEINALVHATGGIGVGILIASPFANPHPVRWAVFFIVLSVLGHLYAFVAKS